MKNMFVFASALMISSAGFATTVVLTDVYDIMDFLRKNPEALVEASACTAATGTVCRVTSIEAPRCVETAGGNQMYVTVTLKGVGVSVTQSLNIPCPKVMPVSH